MSAGNVTDLKSKLSRCKAWCSGLAMAVSCVFSLHSLRIRSLVSDAAPSRSKWQW